MPKVPVSSNEPVAPDLGVLANRAPISAPITGNAKLKNIPAKTPPPRAEDIEPAIPLKKLVVPTAADRTLPRAPPIAPPIWVAKPLFPKAAAIVPPIPNPA